MSYRLLSTLSISVLGCGDIGLEVAKYCKNFGMTVYGMVMKLPNDRPNYVVKFFLPTDLPEFLKKSDFICNIPPKTEKTTNMLSGSLLEYCRKAQSTFIKFGLGSVIDDDSFPQESEIVVLLFIVASSFFPSLWFKLVLDFDFCIRKNFINTVRLKLLKKEEQVKNKLSME